MNGLPSEILSQIAEFVPTRARLIALRGCSRSSAGPSTRGEHPRQPEDGPGAKGGPSVHARAGAPSKRRSRLRRRLSKSIARGESAAALAAIRSFVITGTQGRLRCLVFHNSTITPTQLVDLCRACPLLTDLSAAGSVPNLSEPDISIDEWAAEIGAACPLLERVNLPEGMTRESAGFTQTLIYITWTSGLPAVARSYDRIAMSARPAGAYHLQPSASRWRRGRAARGDPAARRHDPSTWTRPLNVSFSRAALFCPPPAPLATANRHAPARLQLVRSTAGVDWAGRALLRDRR